MNNDVLATIASFGDMDTRRSMGSSFAASPLKRNVELDEKLRAIYGCRTEKYLTQMSRRDPTRPCWTIRLNERMGASVHPHGYPKYDPQLSYRCCFTYSRDDGTWIDKLIVMEYESGARRIMSSTCLDKPYSLLGFNSVFADQVNGQWCIRMTREHLSLADCDTLRLLGYKMALAEWCRTGEPAQYVKI